MHGGLEPSHNSTKEWSAVSQKSPGCQITSTEDEHIRQAFLQNLLKLINTASRQIVLSS
jgi:hypothetical protein